MIGLLGLMTGWFPRAFRLPAGARRARGVSSFPLTLALLLLVAPSSDAATARVSLDRNTLPVGETATLTLTVEGTTPRTQPSFNGGAGLRITAAGRSTSVSLVNGRQTMEIALTYTVEALREGDFTLPGVEIQSDAGPLRTRPVAVKVVRGGATPVGEGQASLRLVPSKTSCFVGELVPLEIQLYVEEGRLQQGPQLQGEGFNFGKIGDQPTQTRTRVGNRTLNVVTFRTVATPVKTGKLSLGPIWLQMEVPVPGSRQDFFGFRQSHSIRVTADALPLEVQPLPPGAPADFSGAIGQFTLDYNAGPTRLAVGDPITLKVTLTGSGPIESLTLPSLDGWQGFKFYPPSSKTELADPMETSGSKRFEQVVVPQSPEIRQLPPFTWSYFDPE
ncbi:MAG TPA: hypothetical protein DCM86_16940, partial [Verrucomicrobiales bacterium]|nr:hypothetical protein [Verrucomicrobiales bacterium]